MNKHHYKLRNYNFILILLLLLITAIGLAAISSSGGEYYTKRQLYGFILGFVAMIIISLIDYSFLLKFHWFYYVLNLVLLILVMFIGDDSNGAQRWVEIGGIRFQPSEFAKILLILFFAQFIMKYREKLNTFKIISILVILFLPPLVLILKQPDLSTSIMVSLMFLCLLFIGGLSMKIIIGGLAIAVPSVIVFLSLVLKPDQKIIEPYQQQRILAWLYPDQYTTTTAYQQTNAKIAIGSGQLWGKGLYNNEITSVKNGNFISEPHTDFIFTIIGEELGFVGSVITVLILLLIALQCLRIARKAKDLAGQLICVGVASIIGFQSFMNIAVATGVMPNTGIPLPFVSYGLTSLVSLYIGFGFVLNVGLQGIKKSERREVL